MTGQKTEEVAGKGEPIRSMLHTLDTLYRGGGWGACQLVAPRCVSLYLHRAFKKLNLLTLQKPGDFTTTTTKKFQISFGEKETQIGPHQPLISTR